jgi:shikimate dehydrogenase
MNTISTATQLCAVIGHPVGHSLSPQIHNAAFQHLGLDYVYLAFDVTDLPAAMTGMRALPSFRGMSVTIPHKQGIIALLDEVDPTAARIGSVNTVINDNGRLLGLSTDGPGTLRSFEEAGVSLAGKRVLFLGTGGAARAVAFAMAEQGGVAAVTVAGRTPQNVNQLAADLGHSPADCELNTAGLGDGLPDLVSAHDVIINATPMGMAPESVGKTLVTSAMLRPGQVVFDMVYRPLETRLLQEAGDAGAIIVDGLSMLVNQAALQFEAWTGQQAPRDVMRQAALAALQQ